MTTANAQLAEIRQYIEDLEVGLTERLDALAARLAAIESRLARIDANLAANGPTAAGETGRGGTCRSGRTSRRG